MAQRSIGQERLGFSAPERTTSSLDALVSLIDWRAVAALLDPLYPASKGEPAWPPLAMFKALLLSIWYDLSDVKLAEALDDRASFHRFCGFSANEATPERTAFVRFRRLLVATQLDRSLFETVTMRLKVKAVTVKTGTLVDATIIASASEDDDDARWVKHKTKRAVNGYKALVGADADTSLCRSNRQISMRAKQVPMPCQTIPVRCLPTALIAAITFVMPCWRRAAFPESSPPACGAATKLKLSAGSMNGTNRSIACTPASKIFGTWKRCYGLRRMRWRGLAKGSPERSRRAAVQVHLTAIAYNLKRTMNILSVPA